MGDCETSTAVRQPWCLQVVCAAVGCVEGIHSSTRQTTWIQYEANLGGTVMQVPTVAAS